MGTFYVDFVVTGNPRKAPFVLRTDDQMSMFCKSGSKSLSDRVVQRVRIVNFEKGSPHSNTVLDKSAKISTQSASADSRNIQKTEQKVRRYPTHTCLPRSRRGSVGECAAFGARGPRLPRKNRRNSACFFRYFKRTFHDILSDRETILEKHCSFLMLLDSTTLKRVRFTSKVNYRALNCKLQ